MSKNIKFVHCADIHLGANPFEIEERFEDMGKAFEQVCEFAIAEKVDFMLVAGDFFHNKVLNPKTLEQAMNSLEKLKNAEIPVFLTEGNHDMETYSNVYSWLQFLSSKKLITLLRPNRAKDEASLKMWDGKEGAVYLTDNATIIGLGYPGSTAGKYIEKVNAELEELIKENKFEEKPIICMLHTGIDRFLTEAMGGLKEEEIDPVLEKVNYLALGHIHTRYENIEKHYYNPGSIECVRITDNPFNRGFYFVQMDTESKNVEAEFKLVNTRNSVVLDLNLDELTKEYNLENKESSKKEEPLNEEELYEMVLKRVKAEYEKNCIPDSKIMLQVKLNGAIVQGTMEINIGMLKEKIASEVPVLHQEIINLVRYVSEDEIVVVSDIAREEIDKIVLEDKIAKAGFEGENISKVFNIIEKMKEYGAEESIDIDGAYGEEIEKMLMELM